MADDPLDSLRLSLMHDVLPVGMAMLDRARQGGASRVAEAFRTSKEPLQELRQEGEPAARSFRDRLDQVSPGLGNPVMPVKVAVDDEASDVGEIVDQASLMEVLSNIEDRLGAVDEYLQKDIESQSNDLGSESRN